MPKTRSTAGIDNFVISVVGGAIMDLIYKIERMPEDDESLDAKDLEYKAGGKGSNTSIAAYRAQHKKPADKAKPRPIDPANVSDASSNANSIAKQMEGHYSVAVYLNTNVGEDDFGKTLRTRLRENGIDISGIGQVKGELTGTCAVFVSDFTGDSRDIGFPGANTNWTPSEQDSVRCLTGKDREIPDLIICHLETKVETVEAVLAAAAKHGVETLLNPSPPLMIESKHYANMTHLIVNKKEAAELSPTDKQELGTIAEYKEAARHFLDQGVKNVVITLGKEGAYYATNTIDGIVPAVSVPKVIDATGAGDTFVGYYAMEYVRQKHRGVWEIQKATELGCRAAARTIQQKGAQTSIPWADEIEQ